MNMCIITTIMFIDMFIIHVRLGEDHGPGPPG